MPKVVITHNVVDVDNWLKGKSERSEAITGLGGSNVVDHVAHDGSNSVAVTIDIDDVDGMLATAADPTSRARRPHGAAWCDPSTGGLRRQVVILQEAPPPARGEPLTGRRITPHL
jgi:hypothetical protein